MEKNVSWSGSGSFSVSFNFRANSSYSGSSTTNANINVTDANTGTVLYHDALFSGGYDSGWQTFSQNLSSYVQGHTSIKIELYLFDAWQANWKEQNWYDNILVSTGPGPIEGFVILGYESIYDSLGRINETEILSPSDSVLSYSTTHYDNWSNVIYTKDYNGQQTWYSYANTNTSNAFEYGASGFTNSFYTNNTVSPNIHDLLVGEAYYQNTAGSSSAIESYYNYNSAGELIHEKQLHVPNGFLDFVENVGQGGNAGPTSTLTVDSVYENGTSVSGYYAVLYQNGTAVATGFTPVTFTLNNNQRYAVQVQNYGGYGFDYWADTGSSNQTRNISINSNAELLAVYKPTGGSTPPTGNSVISVNTAFANGTKVTGFYTTLWQNNQVIAQGFSPINFTVTCCSKYDVEVENYGGYVFSNWADGNQTGYRQVVPQDQNTVVLTAVYSYKWLVTSYTYDQYGNMITSTDPLGRTTYYQYSSTYNHAYLTQSSIIAAGQNISTSYAYNSTTGWMTSQTNPDGFTTFYSYDTLGRLTTTTYPAVNGVIAYKSYIYNDTGNYMTIVDENGNAARQYFDGLENLISIVQYNGSEVYSEQNYTYNYLDEIASHSTATGNTYTYSYDAMGFQTKATNPDGTYQTGSYSYTSNVKTVTDENGHETQYGYDWMNNLIWVKQYYNSTNYYMTNYTYDLSGNLLSSTDANRQTTTYQYDELNRLVMTKFPDGTSQTQNYNAVGNIVSKTDAMGITTSYSYDVLNRLTNITYPDHSTVAYTYDKAGNRLQMSDSSGSSYYSYDARARLTNETDVTAGVKSTVLYTYDKAGNILSIVYPNKYVVNYSYDSLERVSSMGNLVNFSYTKDNKISEINDAEGIKTMYTYNSRDMPTRILSTNNGTTLMNLNYKYDAFGNVLSLNSQNYTYDALNRLTNSTGPGGLTSYTYDGAGNMIKYVQGGTVTLSTYDSYNRLLTFGNVSLSYNADGDLVKVVNGSNTYVYTYDDVNRLTSVEKNGNTLVNNTFNSDGKLVSEKIGSSKVFFTYEGSQIISEYNQTTSSYAMSMYANGLQLVHASTALLYYLSDALGSVRVAVFSSNTVAFSTDYEPFGLTYNSYGNLQEFLFNDKFEEFGAGGIYLYGARFYDPAIDRYMSEDTDTGSLDDPMSQNRYVYASDNPLSIVDPNGHDSWWSSITSAVSNAVSDVSSGVNTVENAVSNLASDVSNTLSSPQTQAIALTAGIDVGTALAVGLTGGAILATPAGGALLGAAVSATTYTVLSGSQANLVGAAEAAGSGAVVGAITAGVGELLGDGTGAAVDAGLERGATTELSDTWVSPESLTEHFQLHGPEFGAQSEEEYAGMANNLLKRAIGNQLPMKINVEEGLQYAYDPETKAFGAYTLPDLESQGGNTVTFHIAEPPYFLRQPGFSPW